MWTLEKKIRIGTRESALATWQAKLVQSLLQERGLESELIFIKTEGDINITTPLYELGVQGIFTKALDAALLNDKIDIAVHSMKDVPVILAKGLIQAAVLERASHKDLLVWNHNIQNPTVDLFLDISSHTIATSSVRRKAQWLHKYPSANIENIRGNVNTRLRKLHESDWKAAIFAAAGLERIGLRPTSALNLDWMLPAPAQGAIMIASRQADVVLSEAVAAINHSNTEICTTIERSILHKLKGGCSTPISALAEIMEEQIFVRASVLSLNGREKVEAEKYFALNEKENAASIIVEELMKSGAGTIIEKLREDESC